MIFRLEARRLNDVGRVGTDALLTTAELAARPDFVIGQALVCPSTRTIAGPGGSADLEPRVMQVLVVLADASGRVVTRASLFERCWGGVYVGDDSLNRAIGAIRKLSSEIAAGSFEIETIPRTGYRLIEKTSRDLTRQPVKPYSAARISRRTMVAWSAGVALAGTGGLGLWAIRSRDERRFNDLVSSGEAELEYGDGSARPAAYLRQAVAIRPNDGAAQGLLAFALMARTDNGNKVDPAVGSVDDAERAANAALRVDPNNANARLALIQLQRTTLDLAATEDRLRGVLASAPRNIFAMRLLWNLLQSAGRSLDALGVVQSAISIKPLAAGSNFPLAQLLWIVGRTAEADRVIDRAMQFWPSHRYVRFARFTIFAFTGRPRTALAMLDNDDMRPQSFSPSSVALWRTSLVALDHPSAANVANARGANLDAVKRDPRLASQAVLSLSALGEVDAAFEIANDLLLFQAPGASAAEGPTVPRASSVAWRFTPWLFTPPAAPLRADRRFAALVNGTGLTAYWAKRRIKPDYQR